MASSYLPTPKSWFRSTLSPDAKAGLILKVETGSTPATTRDEFWDGDIPWLTPKEVTDFGDNLFVSRTERTLTKAGLAEVGGRLLPAGTVLLTKRAPVGCVVVNAIPMVTNQGFLSFACGPRLRPIYLAHWLRANRPYLDKVANGSTYPELYAGDLFEFEIAVPDLPTQDRIIEVISSLQFLTALGHPLEQSVFSPEALLARQEQTRRLRSLRDSVLPLLLGGELDAAHLKNGFFATT